MIFVDSSVWIDYFRLRNTRETEVLDSLLEQQFLVIGDLVLAEVLQGFDSERDFNNARQVLGSLLLIDVGGRKTAIQAARNYRALRSQGITIRKTIDTLIATCCIENGFQLLHNDRDFDPFVQHLGLRVV